MARFKSFDIVANALGVPRRLAKVEFGGDGSVYIFFPGFADTSGIVCRAVMRAGVSGQTILDLKDNGRVTSHLVKYAHHPDGRAHFSQTGKVKTEIRRQSVPLHKQRGHLFTIQVQDFTSFPRLPYPRKAQLTFNLLENVRALKITGWRYHFSDLKYPEGVTPVGSPKGIHTSDGVTRVGLFVCPPEGAPFDDVALFLAVEEIPWLSEDKVAHLLFLGGFDNAATALDHSVDTEFLAFAYPCSDFQKLVETIGSIDLASTLGADQGLIRHSSRRPGSPRFFQAPVAGAAYLYR